MRVYRIYVDLFPDSTVEQRRDVFNGIAQLVGERMEGASMSVYGHGWQEVADDDMPPAYGEIIDNNTPDKENQNETA